jgi:hypothetical protein
MASLRNVAYTNPIIGSLWSAMSQILTQEITRLRALPNSATMVADFMGVKDDIGSNIAFVFAKNCPLCVRVNRTVPEYHGSVRNPPRTPAIWCTGGWTTDVAATSAMSMSKLR